MMCPPSGRRRASRLAGVLTAAALGSGAVASAAQAASLKITMPAQVKKGASYEIKISGSYKRSEITGRAYLIATIQFANQPCKATAQAENRTSDFLQWYLAPPKPNPPKRVGVFKTSSPFTQLNGFIGGTLSTRHVCAWLYPKFINAGDTTKPIARADKKYRVVKA